MKTCTSCKKNKPLTDYHNRSAAPDGKQSRCIDCNKEQRKAYYKTAHGRDKNTTTGKRWRQQTQAKVYEYLLYHSCTDCGNNDPIVLEFDHLRDKEFSIAQGVKSGYSWSRVLKEIAKCEVVCANCHRKRTAKRNGSWYKSFRATGT